MFMCLEHKQKCLAEMAAKEIGTPNVGDMPVSAASVQAVQSVMQSAPEGAMKDVILAALDLDRQALKKITDVAQKVALKREQLIPKWLPILEKYRDEGQHAPFAPLVWFVIWLLDVEDIGQCISWADLAILQQQKLPEHFSSSSLETFIAEGIHDWAQRQLKAGHSAEPFLTMVLARIESKQWLVTEPIALNKLYKLAAQFAESNKDFVSAETFYEKCIEVNPEKHGVKTALAKVKQKLGKA